MQPEPVRVLEVRASPSPALLTEDEATIRIEMLNCSKEDMLADFEDTPEVVKSGLYKLVYSAEFGQFGGRPGRMGGRPRVQHVLSVGDPEPTSRICGRAEHAVRQGRQPERVTGRDPDPVGGLKLCHEVPFAKWSTPTATLARGHLRFNRGAPGRRTVSLTSRYFTY